MVRTTPKLFQRLRTALSASQGHVLNHPGGQNVRIPVKATMRVQVRRFQGVYECGCKAEPLGEPETCEIHDKPRKYLVEDVETTRVEISREED